MPKSVAVVLSLVVVLSVVVALPARAQRETPRRQDRLIGAFDYLQVKDAVTDADRSRISTFSQPMPTDRLAFLAWSCRSNGLNVGYTFGTPMGSVTDRAIVRYSFADAPATTFEPWALAIGNVGVIMPMVDVMGFTHAAQSFRTVAIRVKVREHEVTDTFRLDGLTEALRLLPCYRPDGR